MSFPESLLGFVVPLADTISSDHPACMIALVPKNVVDGTGHVVSMMQWIAAFRRPINTKSRCE
jgi:hypothetical protein